MPEIYKIVLQDKKSRSTMPPPTVEDRIAPSYETYESNDKKLDKELLLELNRLAVKYEINVISESETQDLTPRHPERFEPHYYGGMPWQEILTLENITYASGSIAAITAFINQALDTILKWRELKNGRSAKVDMPKEECKNIEMDDLEKALRKLEKMDKG